MVANSHVSKRKRLKVIMALSMLLATFLCGLILWFIIWLKKKMTKTDTCKLKIIAYASASDYSEIKIFSHFSLLSSVHMHHY